MVIVLVVETLFASLVIDVRVLCMAAGANSRIVEAVLILAIAVAVSIVIFSVEAFTACFGKLAVELGAWIFFAVRIVAVGATIVIVIFLIKTEGATLVLLHSPVSFALAAGGYTL